MDIKIIKAYNNKFPVINMFDCMGNETNDLSKVYSIVVLTDINVWLALEADESIIFTEKLH